MIKSRRFSLRMCTIAFVAVTALLIVFFLPARLKSPATAQSTVITPDLPAIPPGQAYKQANLLSDIPGLGAIQDPFLVNPWGVVATATSPFWVANNGTSTTQLLRGDVSASPFVLNPNPQTITIGGGLPTGVVANATSDFNITPPGGAATPARFIFDSITGNIVAWVPALGTTTQIAKSNPGHVYTGLAIGSNAGGNRLYAADFVNGHIDVFDGTFAATAVAGNFIDATIPFGFNPHNIQNIGGSLYVTYAKIGPDGRNQNGPGFGFVRKFDTNGVRDLTFAAGGPAVPLDSPWGVAVAPASFGIFGGALLVGNFSDNGIINAFNPSTGAFLGTLKDESGNNIVNSELWALAFGNGGSGGDPNTLYFSAGTSRQEHGLFGSLKPTTATATSLIQFSSDNFSISETGGHIDVSVTRSGNVSAAATVNINTADQSSPGHASQKSDYEIALGTLTFNPGETSKTLRILIVDDKLPEGNENIDLFLSNPTGAGVGLGSPNTATVTIIDDEVPAPIIATRSATGPNPAAITAARDQFRSDIGGGTVAGANGSFGGVRREINWDGVPAASSAPNNLPANFFNSNSPRGVVFGTPGTGFQVSGANTDAGAGQPAAPNFGNINPTYSATFQQFSPQRLFTALGSNITDVNFFVPGTATPATVNSFGAIFTDVDNTNDTRMQFFDVNGLLITEQAVPSQNANGGLSFLGVTISNRLISRVRIISGNSALGPNDDPPFSDMVVMDDFIYNEPQPFMTVLPPLSNPIDNPSFFVRQNYLDFLNREPDAAGLSFWTNQITSCGSDANCIATRRINVSAAFFLSNEFQSTGMVALLANKAAFGPSVFSGPASVLYGEFERGDQALQKDLVFGTPNYDAQLDANKQAFFNAFVNRPEFKDKYDSLTNAQYVDALLANIGLSPFDFTVNLTNSQEVPPTNPTASGGGTRSRSFGTARFQINAAETAITITATISNIDVGGTQTPGDTNDNLAAAHIHAGASVQPGVNGGVVWGFFGSPFNDNNPDDHVVTLTPGGVGATFNDKWDAPEGNNTTLAAQLPNIRAGRAYINFHTTQFGGGEIRGNFPATQAFRDSLVNSLNAATDTRATVLRKIAESGDATNFEFNRAFVLMQYFGYLRRDPDVAGFNFWLNKLNSFGGNFTAAEMVKAFLVSTEYRQRFGAN